MTDGAPETPGPEPLEPNAVENESLATEALELGLISRTGEFSAYPPIADYGFLSDCEVTALVAPSAAIEWMCLPRMDCPSLFGAILDRNAGSLRHRPDEVMQPAGRSALPARDDGARDELGLRRGLDRRARLPGDGSLAAREPGAHRAHQDAD